MSNDLNLCQFIGRLGKDPELKYLPSGDPVCNISIACGKSWKDKDSGEKKEATTWVSIVAFKRLAEIMGEYLRKGSQVYIAGELRVRTYEKDGNTRYVTEIVAQSMQMIGSKPEGERAASAPRPAGKPREPATAGDTLDDGEQLLDGRQAPAIAQGIARFLCFGLRAVLTLEQGLGPFQIRLWIDRTYGLVLGFGEAAHA